MFKQAAIFVFFIAITQCSVARTMGDSSLSKIPSPEEMLEEIIKVTGLAANFELKKANVLNIEASISHRKKKIAYNPVFINWLNGLSQDKWSVMALLAHEIGHHEQGHTRSRKGSAPKLELQADEFAGSILYKLGASLQESQKVMNYIARMNTSATHPGRMDRLQAIQTGWLKAAHERAVVSVIPN